MSMEHTLCSLLHDTSRPGHAFQSLVPSTGTKTVVSLLLLYPNFHLPQSKEEFPPEFWAIPISAQSLFLNVHLEITLGGAWGDHVVLRVELRFTTSNKIALIPVLSSWPLKKC